MPDLREKLGRRVVRAESMADSVVINGLRRMYNRGETKQFVDDSFTRVVQGIHEFVDGEYINTVL